tara:strand:- start:251 stop:493 length:243 start_codon:yes stop_codon:yes gene_type:complete
VIVRLAPGVVNREHFFAGVAQLVERQSSKLNVASSILVSRLPFCPDGEIGRHNGLKIRCPLGRAGSSPAPGTKFSKGETK